jgi:transposase
MWYPSTLTPGQKEERRLEGGRLLLEGRLTHAQIAARLGVTTQAVGQWAESMGSSPEGLDALRGRRRPGRPPLLTPEQWDEVLRILAPGALQAGAETERWTLRRIRRVILDRFGVDYQANYLAERLRASGWTCQVPAVQARERDEELVRAWLDRDWPRIKKRRGAAARRSSASTRRASPSGRGRGRPGPPPARPLSCDGSANAGRSRRRSD